jgi:hypothetical protein
MQTERKPCLVRLRPECADLYNGRLELGRAYHGLFSPHYPPYMSIMGTTVDRADKRHSRSLPATSQLLDLCCTRP